MRKLRYATSLLAVSTIVTLFGSSIAFGQAGDTIRVNAFDRYLWLNHGSQTRWAVFPDTTHRYERILMRYKLTCPNPTCGEWDYTTNVFL